MRIISRLVVLFIVLCTVSQSYAQTAGSWRIVGKSSMGIRIDRPAICGGNYPSVTALAACVQAGGEAPSLWSTSPSAAEVRIVINGTYLSYASAATLGVNAAEQRAGDQYIRAAGSLGVFSSSGTVIGLGTGGAQKYYSTNGSHPTLQHGSSGFFILAFNAGIPADATVENPECYADANASPPTPIKEYQAINRDTALTTGWRVRATGHGMCLFRQVACMVSDTAGYEIVIGGEVRNYVWCLMESTGQIDNVEGPPSEIAASTEDALLQRTLEELSPPGTLPNGSVVNSPTDRNMWEMSPQEQLQAVCSMQGTEWCVLVQDKVIQTITIDGCTQKVYWHDGNRASNGACIGAYDRDWPSPTEPYNPDNAFRWDADPTPATAKNISDNKLSIIRDDGKVGQAATKVASGGVVHYPASAGGGTSNTNTGDADAAEPPPAPVETPEIPGDGTGTLPSTGGFYTSKYPGGVGDIWAARSAEFQSSAFVSSVQSIVPPAGPSVSDDWCMPIFDDTTIEWVQQVDVGCIEGDMLDLFALVLMMSTVFACVSALVGGRL